MTTSANVDSGKEFGSTTSKDFGSVNANSNFVDFGSFSSNATNRKVQPDQEQNSINASVNTSSWGNFGGFDQASKAVNISESKPSGSVFDSKTATSGFDSFQSISTTGFSGGFGSDNNSFAATNNNSINTSNSSFQPEKAFSSGFANFSANNTQQSFGIQAEKKVAPFASETSSNTGTGTRDSDVMNTSSESMGKKKKIFEEVPTPESNGETEKKLKECSLVVENCFLLMEKVKKKRAYNHSI